MNGFFSTKLQVRSSYLCCSDEKQKLDTSADVKQELCS